MKRPKAPKYVEIDEGWLKSWVAYGFVEMNIYLGKHAEFDAYLATHPTKE